MHPPGNHHKLTHMKLKTLLLAALFTLPLLTTAQKSEPLSPEQAKSILSQLKPDSATFVAGSGKTACNCIDSVVRTTNEKLAQNKEFANCIAKQVTTLQLSIKLFNSMKGTGDNKISISTNENSDEYKRYYYALERWLKDSCKVLNNAIRSNDNATDKSYSSNKKAMEYYNEGVVLMREDDYKKALKKFEKATEADPEFAFAWDNLGLCYRHAERYEDAISTYRKSLAIDPEGKFPLTNLPVVYSLMGKNEEAIKEYDNLLKYYPGDAEAFYGVGTIWFYSLKNAEKALPYLCKAYNIYIEEKSAYRSDAEKIISAIYAAMKKDNKEELFYEILKNHNIKAK
jgi:tetratricopeptide (TPR) repeat protein